VTTATTSEGAEPSTSTADTRLVRLSGPVPPELWNRLGTKLLPKLRAGSDLRAGIEFSVVVNAGAAATLIGELRQILQDLGLSDRIRIE
jgi:hypothetical protein